ncbi:Uncharacterized protein ESCO_005067 [Escovopsis weberi]|uniref:Protein-lysine N-methyltransferase EFM6 n=1 Tax=Escovopsis weberi TaxID=150374 RepID=A0A0M8N257_ESCWE|nr:Uncharacterized protein ESCO_005067 [Escovopsis weberi]
MDGHGSSPPLDPTAGMSEDLVSLPALKAKGDTSIDFDGQLGVPIRLHEDVRTGCGGQTWPAGMVLGKHMLRYHRAELEAGNVLELGAGGGLVGLAVAAGCDLRNKLVMTDQDPMLELMGHNIELNGLSQKASAMVLNWDLFAVNEGAVVYFCFKRRRRADMQFVKKAKKAFLVEEVFDEDRPVFSRQNLFLFTFRSRGSKSKSKSKMDDGKDVSQE